MEKNEHREERLIVGVRGEVADKYNETRMLLEVSRWLLISLSIP